jgi:predicted transposase/invertase (TIGR01784 family)
MQVVDRKNVEKRILFYWSKMYTSSIKHGIDFKELKKGIVVLIVNYNLEQLKKISNFMTKWNIREEENPKIILTDDLEFYIIELEKVKRVEENSILKSWLEFIKNPKVVSNMENDEIKKAREELEKISQNEHERYLAELRQKYIMDQKAIQDFGYDKGLEEGEKIRNRKRRDGKIN